MIDLLSGNRGTMVLPGGVGVKQCAGHAIHSVAAVKSLIRFRR